jgi:hypothetical protein
MPVTDVRIDQLIDHSPTITPDQIRALVQAPERLTRLDVARLYAVMLGEHGHELGRLNVRALNEAIIARWSFSGLEYIKREAWKGAFA